MNKRKSQLKNLFPICKKFFMLYKVRTLLVLLCLICSAISTIASSVFIQQIISLVETTLKNNVGTKELFESIQPQLLNILFMMIIVYGVGIASSIAYTQIMAVIGQDFLNKMRIEMFERMESLPIKYFDRHKHGDIMSFYTNDVDTLRQFICQSLPQCISTALSILFAVIVMLSYSLWLFLIVIAGAVAMLFVTARIGGNSARFFMKQQISMAKVEGYIEEMMHGAKVVKVFSHEEKVKEEFDLINEELFQDAQKANHFANVLMPILGNIGNIQYSLISIIGVIFYITGAVNVSFTGLSVMSMSVIIAFLPMSKQFSQSVSNLSQQVSMIAMAMAGTGRILELLQEEEEKDEGYVTLVHAQINEDGTISECDHRTNVWAWKHPHQDGSITYTKLQGDIVLEDVDFGYYPDKIVLHGVNVYAKPGQKIAFVGATGAGKTTITNLINRFYDISCGKIRYDGINISKIKKDDLRRSLGIVLQDTNLFTGTVMENIRYGRLDATDEEVYEAAKIANAYDFITRLPEGFQTMLSGDGANLSQGQRQLISIARAACADAPVMIMDEATSSIDTRTEALVQKGTDQLMEGRTVFVIAHRLSTVQNSDCIMVLDHGRIIERGSHEDLIAQKGTYYQLYTGAFELE
ncbi:MAG TPA: ABC transporter ATP-binding protein [Candidatus Pelethenecus faecipullorum]|uniref:ABC transporter ATP-binding protein n=1 Tax=Candidatus Pelethenecus faecipullorum TaxID=2840900 RepID=A0A9D1GTA5_9MOLU|nr:ABC transporter ATP-binding protein [Candidatus Pelethenecus faecipullorum]